MPCDENFDSVDCWQIYIDNFDEAHSRKAGPETASFVGKASQWSLQPRESGEKLGVIFTDDEDKHKRQEVGTKTLGAEGTERSKVRPSMQRLVDLAEMVFAT